MALNVELLRKVQAAILTEAETFNMSIVRHWEGDCQTPACIAGHAVFQSVGAENFQNRAGVMEEAVRLLGLEDMTPFTIDGWPLKFRRRYANAVRPLTRAKAACAYIDHLIASEPSP